VNNSEGLILVKVSFKLMRRLVRRVNILSDLSRFGVSIEEELLEKFDNMIAAGYNNRSEAIRDLIREKIMEKKIENSENEVVGSLTLLFDHHHRELSEKMITIQHKYPQVFKSTMHLHLSHDICLEVLVVQGQAGELQKIADKLVGLKGVYQGKLTISGTKKDLINKK